MEDGQGQLHNNKRIRGDLWWKAVSHDSATWRSNKTLVDTAGADTVDYQDDKEKQASFQEAS